MDGIVSETHQFLRHVLCRISATKLHVVFCVCNKKFLYSPNHFYYSRVDQEIQVFHQSRRWVSQSCVERVILSCMRCQVCLV